MVIVFDVIVGRICYIQGRQKHIMAVLTLEVDDKEVNFFKNLIQHFPFVSIQDEGNDEDSDEAITANIRHGLQELRAVEQGDAKSRPAREFLNEL